MTTETSGEREAPPPPPPAHLAPWIGQYGHSTRVLDISENNGLMHVEDANLPPEPLDLVGDALFRESRARRILQFGYEDGAEFVSVEGSTYRKHDFGSELVAEFQRSLNPGAFAGLKARLAMPRVHEEVGLVPVADAAPSIRLDIRYATTENFTGYPIYDSACAFLRPVVAAGLARVQSTLLASGLSLVLFDAYRPWAVTEMFWNLVPLQYRAFVADPAVGSKHNRGCAVDVSLCDAVTGAEIEMPSRYDEPTARSHHAYQGGTTLQRWYRDTLRVAMEREGFAVQPDEWWHFDFATWQDYPVENIAFRDLPIICQSSLGSPPSEGRAII